MREVVLSCCFVSVRFSWEYLCQVNRKKLYKDVWDVVFPEPMYYLIYRVGRGKGGLKRVKRMQVPPSIKIFSSNCILEASLLRRGWQEKTSSFHEKLTV